MLLTYRDKQIEWRSVYHGDRKYFVFNSRWEHNIDETNA
jgi:hypothetical protein